MLNLKIIDNIENHILIKTNEPCKIEICKIENSILIYAYKGLKVNPNQEPDIVFDGSIQNKEGK